MKTTRKFNKKILASAIASYAFLSMHGAVAQQEQVQSDAVEEVIVLGVRGAQQSAINTKRNASTIVDGIAAEDVGKLPDVTITDSLQRITGVQVERNAGEGGRLSVRGMQQVGVMLNGEQFLAAGNIFGAQPDFTDVPSQLLRAADVYKSLDVRNASSGITGTINLKTFRPFDFKEGFSAAGGWDLSRGEMSKTNDSTFNGLVNWHSDNVGAMISIVTGDKNLANDYVGNYNQGNYPNALKMGPDSPFAGKWTAAPFFGYIAQQQENERNRDGMNAALQADFGDGFELVVEGFYTQAKEYRRSTGLSLTNRWIGLDSVTPQRTLWDKSHYEGSWTGFPITSPTHSAQSVTGKDGREWIVPDEFDARVLWVQSLTTNEVTNSNSKNFNVELNYDNEGAFTGSLRATAANSARGSLNATGQGGINSFMGNTLQNFKGNGVFYPQSTISQYNLMLDPTREAQVGAQGGRYVLPNPQGYASDPNLKLSLHDYVFGWSGFDTPIEGALTDASGKKGLSAYMANKASWIKEGLQLEGLNHDDSASLRTFSAQGNYKFEDSFVTDVDVGLRSSRRSVENVAFNYLAQFYRGSPNRVDGQTNVEGCFAQWRSIDTPFDGSDCSAGEKVGGNFIPYTALAPQSLDHNGEMLKFVTDTGQYAKGIPGYWAIDPHTFDDPVAFNQKVFGNIKKAVDADNSYGLTLSETSAYAVGNFKAGIVSGNLGVRVVETELVANVSNPGPDAPHSNQTPSEGTSKLVQDYRYVLPSVNLSFDATDDIKFRVAVSKNKQELDLNNYGASLNIFTGQDANGNRIPTSFASGGNIKAKPWLSKNYDVSAEYYIGEASMVSLGAFMVKIDSYTATESGQKMTVDYFGKSYDIEGTALVERGNGEVKGLELSSKIALSDFIDAGVLSNFGIEANYTYSPSSQDGLSDATDLNGEKYPFINNSKQTYNFAVWYQKDKLQARVALNGRSSRFITSNGNTPNSISIWSPSESFLDANVSYDVLDNVTVYVQGSNLTSTDQKQEVRFTDSVSQDLNVFDNEARYSLGVRAKF